MRIQHNMRSMNSNRVLKASNLSKAKAVERLASGYRINRAADDAAGLAISEKMRSQIRGLNQAVRNVEDGISYVQVADGSLEEVQQMLHRMHELAVQSANGTNVSEDRTHLDDEVQQLKREIGDIFENTEFNTKKIWKGEPFLVEVIVGETSINGISISAKSVSNTITDTNKEAMPRNSVRISADSSGLKFYWDAYNGNRYTTENIPWEQDPTGTHTINVGDYLDTTTYPELTGIDFQYEYSALSEAKLTDIIRALNGKTISNYDSVSESTVKNAGLASGVTISGSTTYPAELVANRSFDNPDNEYIEGIKVGGVYSNVTPRADDNSPLEFTFYMRNIGEVKAKISSVYYYSSERNASGENIWWEYYTSGGVQRQSTKYNYISNPKGSLNDLFYALDNGGPASFNSPTSPANGVVYFSYTLQATNSFTTTYGGTSRDVGSMSVGFRVNSGDTRDNLRQMFDSITGVDFNPSSTKGTYRIYNSAVAKAGDIVTRTYGYTYENRGNLTIQAGANDGQILTLDYPVMDNEYLDIVNLKVDTQYEAEKAITTAQEALQKVSKVRSVFGAFQNRLEHTLEYNKNASENLQNAESRLRDADMAEEMVSLSKNNILTEMGQQVLSMANSDPESVLNLLKG